MKARALIAALVMLLGYAGPVVVLTTPVLFATSASAEDWGDALQDGNDKKAFRLLKPLAEQGRASDQFFLAWMYRDGKGVPENYAKAVYWYRKAAEQGYANAQYDLGKMYLEGKGVAKDDVRAYVWWSIAAAQGSTWAKGDIYAVRKSLTREQVAEAQQLSSECWEKYVVPFQN